jgi:D-serine deaminase-like pyridoxal phosphate-dependent protein
MAEALVAFTRSVDSTNTVKLTAFIELDVDDHRAGVLPESDELLTIGAVLASSGLLRGVMTHAGGSYDCRTRAELVEMAERERVGAAGAAGRLRDAGMACPEVSIGSTPTVSVAESFTGVTEVRVGVYVFNDLVMAGLGVCDLSQIALSVLTTVIGHQARRNTLVIDAGWMALSSDRGTSSQVQDQGLGRIVDSNLVVHSANQEHGLVQAIDGATIDFDRYPIGSELRVLPVHACATAAAFDGYRVIGGQGPGDWASFWPRFGGWVARQA